MGINTYNVYPTTQDLSCNSNSNGDQNKTLFKLLIQLWLGYICNNKKTHRNITPTHLRSPLHLYEHVINKICQFQIVMGSSSSFLSKKKELQLLYLQHSS